VLFGGGCSCWPTLAADLQEVAATHGGGYVREVSGGFTAYLNAKHRGRMCRRAGA
jgi:hypothetical protein